MARYTQGGRSEPVSNNERDFIIESVRLGQRMDGRGLYDFRSLKITFGMEYGQVQIQLGRTRVYVVTSCEVTEPKADRPTEGFFTFVVQFSPMAAPEFDTEGRLTSHGIELGRVVERGLRESRAIDTEALCIVAGVKVWSIRLDIHVLDHVGNLTDCCSIAAITALHHFRRPDVTVGEQVIIHPKEDREPVPLSIHHIPLCITFAIFLVDQESVMVVDPQLKEEIVMKGKMTLILNAHRELCGVQKAGGIPIEMSKILEAVKIATVKVKELTVVIKDALKNDMVLRGKEKGGVGIIDDRLMTYGIGTREETDGSIKFCDAQKTVQVKKDDVEKHLPPTFSFEEAQKDFEEFVTRFNYPSTLKMQESEEEGEGEEEGKEEASEGEDDEDEDEEEQLEPLIDEFSNITQK